jgi:phosphohistidine phosphatase
VKPIVVAPLRQLLLLRHAKSSWDDPSLGDHSRPLSRRGREAAVAMGAAMRELGLVPDVVLASSAQRAQETLAGLGPWEEMPIIEIMDALYLASATQLLKVLNGVAETVRSVLLLGHNPGLQELAVQLAGSARNAHDARRMAEKFPTAALAEFAVSGTWGALAPGGARLMRFLRPRDLPLKAG